MKQFILAAFIVVTFCTNALANEGKISPSALKSFQHTFAGAQNSKWSQSAEWYKVSFEQEGHNFTAFYKVSGELVALAKYVSLAELAAPLQTDLKSKIKNAKLIELFELTQNGETKAFATLDNGKKQLVWFAADSHWHRF
jgi:hypothetical protein